MNEDFATKAKITWCPGCPNSAILVAFRQALNELIQEGFLKLENVVAATGIGCHGKILDYLDVNSFTSLHGRLIPTMCGIKLANPELCVVGFSGDGDSYAEGLSHLIHAARRNLDIKIFIHNNQVFALTTGQATPTSPKGFKGASTPFGNTEEPLNPLRVMLSAGATFVARTYAPEIAKTKEIMKAAIRHQGFSYVDIIQPCLTFFDTRNYYQERTYWLDEKEFPTGDCKAAWSQAEVDGEKIPLGIFYESG
jgi:2-oxoglutarate ferredoxin oxidoreductase subunit beta